MPSGRAKRRLLCMLLCMPRLHDQGHCQGSESKGRKDCKDLALPQVLFQCRLRCVRIKWRRKSCTPGNQWQQWYGASVVLLVVACRNQTYRIITFNTLMFGFVSACCCTWKNTTLKLVAFRLQTRQNFSAGVSLHHGMDASAVVM